MGKTSMLKGEIWLINLDPTVGAEIRKTRPAVIVSEDAMGILPLRLIVPLTEWKEHYKVAPWMIFVKPEPMNGLTKPSAADAFQIRSVSEERFVNRIGSVNQGIMDQIIIAIQIVVGIKNN
jgi:mRNA interferase MazF